MYPLCYYIYWHILPTLNREKVYFIYIQCHFLQKRDPKWKNIILHSRLIFSFTDSYWTYSIPLSSNKRLTTLSSLFFCFQLLPHPLTISPHFCYVLHRIFHPPLHLFALSRNISLSRAAMFLFPWCTACASYFPRLCTVSLLPLVTSAWASYRFLLPRGNS